MALLEVLAGELTRQLIEILEETVRQSSRCRSNAEQLRDTVELLRAVVRARIENSGNVDLQEIPRSQINRISEDIERATKLCRKILNLRRREFIKIIWYAQKLAATDKAIKEFIYGPMQVHIWRDILQNRAETREIFDRLEQEMRRSRNFQWISTGMVIITSVAVFVGGIYIAKSRYEESGDESD